MKIYKEDYLVNELDKLDLGTLLAGDSKEFIFMAYNDSPAELVELKFTVNHPEIEIKEAPITLQPNEFGKIKLVWNCSVTLKEGLKTELKSDGFAIYSK